MTKVNPSLAAEAISSVEVRHATVHTMVIDKDQVYVEARNEELKINPVTQRLVDTLYDVYRRRTSKKHGIFNGNDELAPAQKYARAYLLEKTEKDFCRFTKRLTELLSDKAKNTGATTGHVFFAHVYDKREYLLITIVANETEFALSDEMDLKEIERLKSKDFRFAGRIDVTGWRDEQERYLSFLKGTKEVSNYFMAFLGCDTTIAGLKDTKNLVKAVIQFSQIAKRNNVPLSDNERQLFLISVDQYCRKIQKENQPMDIGALCNAVWPEDPDAMGIVIAEASADDSVNDGFMVDTRGLKSLKHITGKGKYWKIEIDRQALNKDNVTFNYKDRTIPLHGASDELMEQLLQLKS